MALTNAQYDEIMRRYEARQLSNRELTAKRTRLVYLKNPRLKSIEDEIASTSVKQAASLIDGNNEQYNSLKNKIAELKNEKEQILKSLDLPDDYFEPVYTCKDCKDTGYIGNNKCHCFKQEIINTIYSQSNIRDILERENFSTFTYDYYSDTDINPSTGLTYRQNAQNAVAKCRDFINDFDNKPKNILFFGDTGVGKTFLSNCIAKELISRGYSVIYFTAFQFFDILSNGVFKKDEEALAAHKNIFDCDLLIIDDLGTEFSTSFTSSQLFLCVNERILRQKSTIISTNLNLNQINEIYSERTLSRLSSNYDLIKLCGDDIRIKKRKLQ